MNDTLLVFAAFLSSSLTAVLGLGGGMLLISLMSVFLPPGAVVPVHGVVQLASNASRGALAPREVRRDGFRPPAASANSARPNSWKTGKRSSRSACSCPATT